MNTPQRLALSALLLGVAGILPAAAQPVIAAAPSSPAAIESSAGSAPAVPPHGEQPPPEAPGPYGC